MFPSDTLCVKWVYNTKWKSKNSLRCDCLAEWLVAVRMQFGAMSQQNSIQILDLHTLQTEWRDFAACWFPHHCWAVTHADHLNVCWIPTESIFPWLLKLPDFLILNYVLFLIFYGLVYILLLFCYIQTTNLPNKMFNPLSKTPTFSLLIGKYVHHLGAYGSCLKF